MFKLEIVHIHAHSMIILVETRLGVYAQVI